jgi:hypothetical protein
MKAVNGFGLILGVIIIAAVGLAVVFSLSFLSLGSKKASGGYVFTSTGKNIAEGCVELALQNLQSNTNYVGTGTSTVLGSTCTYSVISSGAQSRQILSETIYNNYKTKMQVNIDYLQPKIHISSWKIIE